MSEEAAVKKEKALPVITIETWLCKGCDICVAFCPTDVLAMENGVAVVVNLEACTSCQLCDYRCPDFAISVT